MDSCELTENESISTHASYSLTPNLKIGSLQEYVQSKGPIENYSHSRFHKDEVHKIAVLDLRILNLDRNVCNILVQALKHPDCCEIECFNQPGESCWSLVPIDHGLSIPDTLAVSSYEIAWLGFDQSHMPFSPQTLEYIDKIDIDGDLALLETLPFRPVCLRNMRISCTLLKIGAKNGLTLA